MPQSLAKVLVHIVYITKGRHPWLRDENIRRQLYAYKATILRDKVDTPALIIGGFEDHIHALCLLSRKFAVKDVIEEAKTETTKWIKKQGSQYADFHWQSGFRSRIESVQVRQHSGSILILCCWRLGS